MIKEEARDTHIQACRMSALNTVPYVVTLTSVCGLERPLFDQTILWTHSLVQYLPLLLKRFCYKMRRLRD